MPLSDDPEKRARQLANLQSYEPGDPRINRAGKKKGVRNWSTIVQSILGDEELLEKMLKKSPQPEFYQHIESKNGASIIVAAIMIQAIKGDIKAAEWLRKTGFGDKLDLTSLGERVETSPIIISEIKPRVETEAEATDDNRDTEQ